MPELSADVTGTPWRRDPAVLAKGLAAWAQHAIGTDAVISDFAAPDNGMSSETVLFTVQQGATATRYVARLAPEATVIPVFPEYDLALQCEAMRTVARHTSVPVPSTPFYETDERWLGSPFLVMGRVDGRVPTDNPPYVFGGWLMDATPDERRHLQDASVEVLAKLHRITPSTHDLAFLERPQFGVSALDQHLGYQRYYYEWAREGGEYPLIERTFEWLDARRPTEGATVLNWGDGRIGNMMFDGFDPVAVLDWEMAAVGPVEIDLAWMIFLHRFFQDLAERLTMPGLSDFMTRDDVVATYERLTGHTVEALEWFEVFAALRFAIVSVRTTVRGVAYGQQEPPNEPDDVVMFRALLEEMLTGTYWK